MSLDLCTGKFPYDDIYETHFKQYEPLLLSDFQKWAIIQDISNQFSSE